MQQLKKPKRPRVRYFNNDAAPDIPLISRRGNGPNRAVQARAVTAALEQRREAAHDPGDEPGLDSEADLYSGADDQPSEHAQRKAYMQQNWKDNMAAMQGTYITSMANSVQLKEDISASLIASIQNRVDTLTCQQHECPSAMDTELTMDHFAKSESVGSVSYYGLTCEGKLYFHTWTCTCCGVVMGSPPTALQCGCFPCTPIQPHIWYDLTLLQLYQQLGPLEGLSATGKDCQSID